MGVRDTGLCWVLGPALCQLDWEDPSQEWTEPLALSQGLKDRGAWGGPTRGDSSPPPAAQPSAKTSVPGVRKDCLFPISPPPDPNFPRVIGLSEGGREAGQHCVSIVNRKIQLELHCRRSRG